MEMNLRDRLQLVLADEYEVLRELGGGGMSRVFVAREVRLGREVVVKVLPPDLAAGIKVERFEREIQLSARLQHPHIVPILSAGARNDLLYYTMPFVHGPSLSERLKNADPIPLVEAVSILRDVADALSYAHNEGVVHRDVKPQNILLQSHHAVVLDFGVAKALTEAADNATLTSTGLTLGTPMYMAPEQAAADPDVDARADIYSLGVVAYEVLTRRPPFSASSPQALMAAHITSTPAPLNRVNESVPQAIATVVMKCLEKAPSDRWQSAEELCEALNDVGARFTPTRRPESVTAHDEQRSDSEPKQAAIRLNLVRLRRAAIAGISLLALMVVAGLLWRDKQAKAVNAGSLLVLPFDNAAKEEDPYFADGMTDEVITSLVKLDGLTVLSSNSTFALKKGGEKNPKTLGRRFHVSHVLAGTVRRAGNRFRITANLFDVSKQSYAWSNSYEGTDEDVFAVQSKISYDIARALADRLVLREGQSLANKPPSSRAAFDYYLKGNAAARTYNDDSLQLAISYYDSALAIDSSYARAYAGIANAYYLLADDYWEPKRTYPLVRANALRALRLDSTLAEAHASMASYEVSYGWNWDAARKYAERAIELNPNSALAHTVLAWYYVIVRQDAYAIRESQIALNLDPSSYPVVANVVSLLRAAGRYDLAMAQARRLTQREIDKPVIMRAWLSWDLMLSGDMAAAKVQLDSGIAMAPACCKRTRALYYALNGDPKQSNEMLDAFIEAKNKGGYYYRADWIAEVTAATGDKDRTLNLLEQAYTDRSVGLPVFPRNPLLLRLKDDARYRRLADILKVPH